MDKVFLAKSSKKLSRPKLYTLYDYYRSTASYRVRIALNYKQVPFQLREVHLVNNGGEQFNDDYKAINPNQLVPTLLEHKTQLQLSQSLAIINYLEHKHPNPSLYPSDPLKKAWVESIALDICCDIHPLNNLRVLKYLVNDLNIDEQQKLQWYHHWLIKGFDALETRLTKIQRKKLFCIDDKLSLADVCLIPQIYNANRFKLDMSSYPLLNSIYDYCLSLDVFAKAAP